MSNDICYDKMVIISFLKRVATDRTEPHRFASATRNVNKTKNRFVNIMPCKIMMGVEMGVANHFFL